MDRMYFVLPVHSCGIPENVDKFMELEDLDGCCFESIEDAEKFLLDTRSKYQGDYFENFAIFQNISHSIKTDLGYKIMPTVAQ